MSGTSGLLKERCKKPQFGLDAPHQNSPFLNKLRDPLPIQLKSVYVAHDVTKTHKFIQAGARLGREDRRPQINDVDTHLPKQISMPLLAGGCAAVHGGSNLTEYPFQPGIEIMKIERGGVNIQV